MLMALYLREAGPKDAPCIVFLHGLWLSSLMWQPQIERLAQDFHCLAPDLPEHGKSTDIGLLTLKNTSQVLANLIRAHTPHGRAHIVGLSLGGAVALNLLRDVPQVVDHLMVSGTAARFSPLLARLSTLGKPVLRLLKPAPLISLGLRTSKIPHPYLGLLLEDVRQLKPEAILHFAEALSTLDVPQGVAAPVLVTFGQKEKYLTMAHRAARELRRRLPAKAVMVPGVGHIWNLEAPDLFTETVRAWVTDRPLPKELVEYG
jgi:pimeloyl-ACP methyl ester carboxylesterase